METQVEKTKKFVLENIFPKGITKLKESQTEESFVRNTMFMIDRLYSILGMTYISVHPDELVLHKRINVLMEGFRENQRKVELEIENFTFSEQPELAKEDYLLTLSLKNKESLYETRQQFEKALEYGFECRYKHVVQIEPPQNYVPILECN